MFSGTAMLDAVFSFSLEFTLPETKSSKSRIYAV